MTVLFFIKSIYSKLTDRYAVFYTGVSSIMITIMIILLMIIAYTIYNTQAHSTGAGSLYSSLYKGGLLGNVVLERSSSHH
jgi:hypothetical protein